MTGRTFRATCLAGLLALFGSPVFAQDGTVNEAIERNLGDPIRYEAVIKAFQDAVAADDPAAVAALVSYPITVKVQGAETEIETEAAFIEHYEGIMTPGIARAVVEQNYEDLFVSDQGIMFGDGQVWINGICNDDACDTVDVRVIAIQETTD